MIFKKPLEERVKYIEKQIYGCDLQGLTLYAREYYFDESDCIGSYDEMIDIYGDKVIVVGTLEDGTVTNYPAKTCSADYLERWADTKLDSPVYLYGKKCKSVEEIIHRLKGE